MRKTLHESRYFRLSSENRHNPNKRGKGHLHYRITMHNWRIPVDDEEHVRDIVDPLRNISGKHGSSWIFKDLDKAKKKYSMLLLRWS